MYNVYLLSSPFLSLSLSLCFCSFLSLTPLFSSLFSQVYRSVLLNNGPSQCTTAPSKRHTSPNATPTNATPTEDTPLDDTPTNGKVPEENEKGEMENDSLITDSNEENKEEKEGEGEKMEEGEDEMIPLNSRGDIIQFYNKVFIDHVKDFVLKLSTQEEVSTCTLVYSVVSVHVYILVYSLFFSEIHVYVYVQVLVCTCTFIVTPNTCTMYVLIFLI